MFLGIEIGGTKLQLGVGLGDGSPFVALERCEIDRNQGADGILKQIDEVGRRLVQQHRIARVGFGFGGPVDVAAGRVIRSHQVDGWLDYPLADWCQQTLNVPAVLGNDCDVAALAEARFGAGRDRAVVFYVTVGTGVGGGLVIDGKIHGTRHDGECRPATAEIGHLRPGPRADRADLTVESLASGQAIEAVARALIAGEQPHRLWSTTSQFDEATPSNLHRIPSAVDNDDDRFDLRTRCGSDLQQLTAKMVAEAACDGNGLALTVLDQATQTLGWAIAQVVTLIAPDVVVVGGGISMIGEQLFFEPLARHVERFVFPPLVGSYAIKSAELDELVVVHGALALVAGSAVGG